MKILVVDDNIINRKVLVKFLEPTGTADEAVDGKKALELFTSAYRDGEPYQLVLLDIMMPVMDGIEALAAMRRHEKEHHIADRAKIVMVTALDDAEYVTRATELGCERYITKPVKRDTLLEIITELGIEAG